MDVEQEFWKWQTGRVHTGFEIFNAGYELAKNELGDIQKENEELRNMLYNATGLEYKPEQGGK